MSKRKLKFYMKPLQVFLGTNIMVKHDKDKNYLKAPLEVITTQFSGKTKEVELNRIKFIPFTQPERELKDRKGLL